MFIDDGTARCGTGSHLNLHEFVADLPDPGSIARLRVQVTAGAQTTARAGSGVVRCPFVATTVGAASAAVHQWRACTLDHRLLGCGLVHCRLPVLGSGVRVVGIMVVGSVGHLEPLSVAVATKAVGRASPGSRHSVSVAMSGSARPIRVGSARGRLCPRNHWVQTMIIRDDVDRVAAVVHDHLTGRRLRTRHAGRGVGVQELGEDVMTGQRQDQHDAADWRPVCSSGADSLGSGVLPPASAARAFPPGD